MIIIAIKDKHPKQATRVVRPLAALFAKCLPKLQI